MRLHATNKFYKILDDYIDVLFKIKKYDEALEVIKKSKSIVDGNKEVDVLLKTAINEIHLLEFIAHKVKYIPEKIDTSTNTRFYLFCNLLEELFIRVAEIINNANNIDFYNSSLDKAFDDLNRMISKIKDSCTYNGNNNPNSLFSLWDLEDIKIALEETEYDKHIKKDINSLIEIVEQCRDYIEGTKLIAKY